MKPLIKDQRFLCFDSIQASYLRKQLILKDLYLKKNISQDSLIKAYSYEINNFKQTEKLYLFKDSLYKEQNKELRDNVLALQKQNKKNRMLINLLIIINIIISVISIIK